MIMTKIIDEIHARRRRRRPRQEETSSSSSADPPSTAAAALFYSLEFFPPKTQAGLDNLLTRMDRMVRRLRPLFVDVTWGTGGSTWERTMQVAAYAQTQCKCNVLLHLTTTGMSQSKLLQVLEQAKARGIQNVLVLRGDPPKGQRKWQVNDYNRDGYCARAIDLVRLIRQEHGDYFGIAVVSGW
jgi:methylenetetrahydrofolate reductase (NADPH)